MEGLRQDIRDIKATPGNIKVFIILMDLIIVLFFFHFTALRHDGLFLTTAGICFLIAFLHPELLTKAYKAWMTLALIIGTASNIVIVTMVFFLVIVPMGWFMKRIKRATPFTISSKKTSTYWIKKTTKRNREDYLRQY